MLRLEHGIGNDFDMDTAEFTEFREQFLADFAQIPLIIGIDGRSGTGKTSLATQLEQELTAAGHSVHVLHLDDFYPGWDGLFDGVEAWDALSVQLTEGIAGTYTPWDWEAGAPGEVRTVDRRLRRSSSVRVSARLRAPARCVFSPPPRTRCVTNAPWLVTVTRSARTGNAGRSRRRRCSPKSRRTTRPWTSSTTARRSSSRLQYSRAQCFVYLEALGPTLV